jgi:hypothetical protein
MTRRSIPAALFLLLSLSTLSWSKTEFFKLEDLKPGMKGIGKTCYQGSKPEEFQVEILGVMKGISPGANAVLAKFSGGPLGSTGVFEGMSGSPVFIDGKLLGAVAFSFAFPKEAIGGITPISQMVDAFTEGDQAGVSGPRIILKRSMLWDYIEKLRRPDTVSPAALANFLPESGTALIPAAAGFGSHALIPIATPLNLSGFSPEALNLFGPQFKAMGLSLLQGTGGSGFQAAGAKPAPDNSPIEAGSNIVVPLVRGDMDASAGGTVTYIDGDKLYAFGHMLFNLGNTELPMHKGRAITVFPSQQSSFKILETTDPIGTFRQDRGSGIYGVLGQKTRMIPVHLRVNTSRGMKRTLNYEVATDRLLTPYLINLTVFSSIISSERALGVSTLEVKGKIRIKGEQPVEIDNRFSSDSNSPVFASLSVALPVNFLLASGYKNLEFENIDLDIGAVEDDRAAQLDSLRLDQTEIKAGETTSVDVIYSKTDGETVTDSYPVKIPTDITPGPLSLMVADGTTLMSLDARELGEDFIPRDLSQLIKFMNNIRKNDRLYLRIFRRESGAIVRGEGMPGLPPSVLSILNSDRSTGGMSPIHTSPFVEYELPPADYIVSGIKTLNLTVKP